MHTIVKQEQQKFAILNFHGIYNFEFSYPQSVRRELVQWYTGAGDDCMKQLLSHIYDKYFLVTQYKNNVQSLEGRSFKVVIP